MLSPGQTSQLERLARSHGWELLVLFGSTARDGTGRDIDLAVQPATMPDLMTQGRWQRQLEETLEPCPVDLLVLGDGTSPLTRFEVFRDGVCLHEAQAGRFHAEQDRAFFLHADSVLFQRHRMEGPDAP
jgi:predicted nucleotidyltransferase